MSEHSFERPVDIQPDSGAPVIDEAPVFADKTNADDQPVGDAIPTSRIVKILIWLAAILWGIHYAVSEFTDLPTGAPLIASLLFAASAAFARLPEAQEKSLTLWIQQRLFSETAARWLPVFLAGELLVAFIVGIGAVEIMPASGTWTITIGKPGAARPPSYTIPASGQKKRVWFISPRFNPRQLSVNSRGLPERQIELKPWTTVRIDQDFFFRRPAALILPSQGVLNLRNSLEEDPVLVVDVDGEKTTLPYKGEPLWIGVTADVQIPDWIRDDWESWVPRETRQVWLELPRLAVHPELLGGEETVTARIYYPDEEDPSAPGDPLSTEARVLLQVPQRIQEFAQQEFFDVSTD